MTALQYNLILHGRVKYIRSAMNMLGKALWTWCFLKVDNISCAGLLDASFGYKAFSNSVHCNHSSKISASRSSE